MEQERTFVAGQSNYPNCLWIAGQGGGQEEEILATIPAGGEPSSLLAVYLIFLIQNRVRQARWWIAAGWISRLRYRARWRRQWQQLEEEWRAVLPDSPFAHELVEDLLRRAAVLEARRPSNLIHDEF